MAAPAPVARPIGCTGSLTACSLITQDAKRGNYSCWALPAAVHDKMQQPTLKFSSSGGTAQTRAPSFFTLPLALLPSALRDCCNMGSCLSIGP